MILTPNTFVSITCTEFSPELPIEKKIKFNSSSCSAEMFFKNCETSSVDVLLLCIICQRLSCIIVKFNGIINNITIFGVVSKGILRFQAEPGRG